MKFTAEQYKQYIEGKLRLCTNAHTKETRLVPVTRKHGNDKGSDPVEKARSKMKYLLNIEKERAKRVAWTRAARAKKKAAVVAAKPRHLEVQAPSSTPERKPVHVPRPGKRLTAAEVALRAQKQRPLPWGSIVNEQQRIERRREYGRRYRARHIEQVRAKARARAERIRSRAKASPARTGFIAKLNHLFDKMFGDF